MVVVSDVNWTKWIPPISCDVFHPSIYYMLRPKSLKIFGGGILFPKKIWAQLIP